MPRKGGCEIGSAIVVVIVHFSQILNKQCFGFRITAPPIFVCLTVGIIIVPIDVIFIDLSVTIIVGIIYRSIVNIIVGTTSITCSWGERACRS